MARKSEALTTLAADWRDLLFPHRQRRAVCRRLRAGRDLRPADGARRGIAIGDLHHAAVELKKTSSLIGTALQLLTDEDNARRDLPTSMLTLERVLEVVDWPKISKGRDDAWLYFYEEFL
ncbi:MAG: DNA methyltransferase, partial [Rhizobiales bacterium]|nr:DNA methyltransferase [Hyphomicrobiales bacterium]